jgi:hypothetical protein
LTLATLPAAIITRLRTISAFSNRVAGAVSEEQVSEQTNLGLPRAFVLPASIEPGDTQISPLDQEMLVRIRILIIVSNTADERGQAGTAAFLGLAADVQQALIGWAPSSSYAPMLTDGVDDSTDSNRDALWGTVVVRTTIMSSEM